MGVCEWHHQHIDCRPVVGPLIPDLQNLIKWPNYIQLCLLGGAWPDLTLLVKAKAKPAAGGGECWVYPLQGH